MNMLKEVFSINDFVIFLVMVDIFHQIVMLFHQLLIDHLDYFRLNMMMMLMMMMVELED